MKRFLSTSIILSSVLLLSSSGCDKNEPEPVKTSTVTVSKESISVSYASTTETISVTADCDWGISSEDKTWCSVSPSGGGSGTSSVKVKIDENGTDVARNTSIVVRYGSNKIDIPVRQNYKVEAVDISDAGFLKALLAGYDADQDGILSTVEAAAVTKIEASGYGIRKMDELNTLFPNVTYLDCSNNDISELDISMLTKLNYFDCTGNSSLKTIHVWSGFKPGKDFRKPDAAEYVEPDIVTPAGYTLVWSDEFAGSRVDNDNWRFENWAPGYVNNELQRYVSGGVLDGNYTAFVEDGKLNIRAMKYNGQVISARMNSMKSWTYGYMEASIKLPKGKGTWPAFWMMPNDFSLGWPACGEIDIMEEVGVNPNYTSSSIHTKSYNHTKNTQKTKEIYTRNAESEFHVYAVEWTADYLQFYTDGVAQLRFENDGTGNNDTWPFNKSFYIILNLAWGGDWGGWNGVDESALPCTMQVEYVRVFQKK